MGVKYEKEIGRTMLSNYWLLTHKKKELQNIHYAMDIAIRTKVLASDGRLLIEHLSEAWEKQCREWEDEANRA